MGNETTIPLISIHRLRMSTDGTGIRTLIGTYGCPLRCQYCLNPHCRQPDFQPALRTAEQILQEIKVDNLYFQATNGGITIGGGEPLLHTRAIAELLRLCPKTWSVWLETSLYAGAEAVTTAAALFDHFVVDIKSMDPEIYRRYTGGDSAVMRENLLRLLSLVGSARITVRVPQIPGFADEASQQASVLALEKLGFTNIDTFCYVT
ncbi:MAG: radical SAM protein [Clostridia bacterium]|nr:radical SAM protein [Clostridia bacterium]